MNDLTELIRESYLYVNNIIKTRLFNLICDAPAKSFVLCVKGHTGFYSCTKCVIKGEYMNCLLLMLIKIFKLVTVFFNNIPGFLPISNIPLDYIHLACLGVVKKIILLWMKGSLFVRFNLRSINKISHLLMLLKSSTPNEFVRRP
ncbi:hypothetical protein ACFW04_014412 [Cataglyphis niger]